MYEQIQYCALVCSKNQKPTIFFKMILSFNAFNFDIFKFSLVCKCEKYLRILVLLLLLVKIDRRATGVTTTVIFRLRCLLIHRSTFVTSRKKHNKYQLIKTKNNFWAPVWITYHVLFFCFTNNLPRKLIFNVNNHFVVFEKIYHKQ